MIVLVDLNLELLAEYTVTYNLVKCRSHSPLPSHRSASGPRSSGSAATGVAEDKVFHVLDKKEIYFTSLCTCKWSVLGFPGTIDFSVGHLERNVKQVHHFMPAEGLMQLVPHKIPSHNF